MSNHPKNADQTFANLLRSDQAEPARGPSTWDSIAAGLAAAAAVTGEFAKEQIHAAGQDLVSRVLLEETYSPPKPGEKEREHEQDKDRGMDR